MNGFLIDENLPVSSAFGPPHGVHSVLESGVRKSDQAIWLMARENDWVIVTKDTDFFQRWVLEGAPPKVVWIRAGNMRLRAWEAFLVRVWPEVLRQLESAEMILVHQDRIEALSRDGYSD